MNSWCALNTKAKFKNIRRGYAPKVKKPALKICGACRYINSAERDECSICRQPLRAPSKYGNKKTTVDGIEFDSKKEAKRWGELQVLLKAGRITEIERQVMFELAPSVKFSTSPRATPTLRYVADFVYFEHYGNAGETKLWRSVVEDAKGFRTADYKIKRHLMLAVHKIEVSET